MLYLGSIEGVVNPKIIQSAAAGNARSFRKFVEHYQNRIFAIALIQTRDVETARDATQETFIEAYRKLDKLHDLSKVGSWLSTIVTRKCSRQFRKSQNTSELGEIAADQPERNSVEQKELRENLLQGIEKLPAPYRQVISMRYLEEMELGRIAKNLNKTIGHINVLLHRARTMLKTKLEHKQL